MFGVSQSALPVVGVVHSNAVELTNSPVSSALTAQPTGATIAATSIKDKTITLINPSTVTETLPLTARFVSVTAAIAFIVGRKATAERSNPQDEARRTFAGGFLPRGTLAGELRKWCLMLVETAVMIPVVGSNESARRPVTFRCERLVLMRQLDSVECPIRELPH
jgi:hypothetical protein